MLLGKSKGLPGEFLLLFTLLIWFLFFLIYLGNKYNKLNRWCFLSGMCFSLGVFKEYLYFTLFPGLIQDYPWLMNEKLSLTIYSLFTAIMYYFAMPAAIIFAFYFSNFDKRHHRLFSWLRVLVFVPAVLFGLRYPYTQTRYYQLYDYGYYLTAAIYNWICGIIITVLIIETLRRERKSDVYQQKRLVAVLILIPIWYELISAFLIHALGLKSLFKLWQGNLLIIFVLVIYYLYHAFNGGIMGVRLMHEAYDWDKEGRLINKSAHFIRHIVKNEMAKIEWCAKSIEDSILNDQQEIYSFTQIIIRSMEHLNGYMAKINDYSQDIVLDPELVNVKKLVDECVSDLYPLKPGIHFDIQIMEGSTLYCDYKHIREVLENLIDNALDAMQEKGSLTIRFLAPGQDKFFRLSVSDTGVGIPAHQLSQLFEPYYTTKTTNRHMGLGLFYCRNVLRKHGGNILIESQEGKGTTFTLCFPSKTKHYGTHHC